MNVKKQSFPEQFTDPKYIAIGIVGISFLFMLLGKMIGGEGFFKNPNFSWMTSSAFLLIFIVLTSALSLVAKDINSYWKKTIPLFLGVVAANSLFAYLFSGTWISEVGSFSSIYFILILAYVILQTFSRFIKKITDFAARDAARHQ